MERFAAPFRLTRGPSSGAGASRAPEAGEFVGVASVFGSLVQTFPPTRIMRGAFTETLREHGERVRILWQHNADSPIGFPLELREIDEGLYLRGRISRTTLGKDALILMQDAREAGQAFDLSIGFDPLIWEMVTEMKGQDPVRHMKKLRLWEVSIVVWGADPLAKVVSVVPGSGLSDAELARRRALVDRALADVAASGAGGGRLDPFPLRRQLLHVEAELGRLSLRR